MSARQKIEDVLKTTPHISLDDLQKQLPDINPVTLKSEFYRLKRKLFGSVPRKKIKEPKKIKKKSNRQRVLAYLHKNTDASLDVLQSAFSEMKETTLRNYLSQWKKEQGPKVQTKQTRKDKPARNSDHELIESLKKTIAAQEKTINAMSKTFELLSPVSDQGELKGMTIAEIKRIAITYLKSIKELKIKR
ncbi:hypothetical protein KKI24_04530 [bacterium]|nr:hypothetical protein [bacterium]